MVNKNTTWALNFMIFKPNIGILINQELPIQKNPTGCTLFIKNYV